MIQKIIEQHQSNPGSDVLVLLNKYKQQLSNNNNNNNSNNKPNQLTEILIRERIVYLTAKTLQNNLLSNISNINSETPSSSQLLLNELTTFVNKVNVKVMSALLEQIDFDQKLNLISKSIDMLYYHLIITTVKPLEKLLQLRALTFNNLSCLYKENKQYEDALKALEVTLQIQQILLTKNHSETYKSIVSTYINKSVILSSLKLHKQAIQTIKTAVDRIEKYRERLVKEVSEMKEKEQHQVKRMTLLACFNIAVEYEHLENTEFAIKFYQIAFKLAKQISNKDVKSQSLSALKKLKPKN